MPFLYEFEVKSADLHGGCVIRLVSLVADSLEDAQLVMGHRWPDAEVMFKGMTGQVDAVTRKALSVLEVLV